MANRTFVQQSHSIAKKVVTLFARVAVSGTTPVLKKVDLLALANGNATFESNAPTTGTGYGVGNGEGVRSVARASQGKWLFTLSDPYVFLRSVFMSRYLPVTLATPTVCSIYEYAANEQTNTGPGNGGTFGIAFVDFAGSLTDPGDGDSIQFEFVLTDATEP